MPTEDNKQKFLEDLFNFSRVLRLWAMWWRMLFKIVFVCVFAFTRAAQFNTAVAFIRGGDETILKV